MAVDTDLYRQIGKLTEGYEASMRSRAALHEKVDKLSDHIINVQHAVESLTQSMVNVNERMAENDMHIEDWKRLKQRGIGIVAGIGVAGTAFGITIRSVGDKFLEWVAK